MPARDWSKLYEKYKGLWVALKEDELTVVASGSDLDAVVQTAIRKGYPVPHVAKMPSDLRAFVGAAG